MKLCTLKITIVVNDKLTQTKDNEAHTLKLEQKSVNPNTPRILITTSIGCRKAVTLRGVTTGGVWGGVSPPQSFETVHSSGKN